VNGSGEDDAGTSDGFAGPRIRNAAAQRRGESTV
jgi:hypothetical protein